ncbi:MAG: zinc-dependent alcohol dehydrogenase family protein [Anaerolineales bacterium]|nr:zinc-dependent alcohol dehydrogenase family protein [Anaerolineales bacterium]
MMSSLPSTMKAAVFYGPNDLRLEQVPTPTIGENEVLLKVDMCGICGTDVHIFRGHFPAPNLPLIPGHEFAGHVVAVGSKVDHVKTDDYVTADINISCGHCYFCRRQQKLFCPQIRQIGVHMHGGLAEYVKAPASSIYHIPTELSPQQGAYIEPLACAVHGQDRANIRPGSSVAIIGGGPMGLAHIQLAKLKGAAPIICSELNPIRLQKAQEMGADAIINANETDPVETVLLLTEGRGADYVIEAVGSIHTYQQAFQMVRRGGTVVAYGAAPNTASLDLKPFDIYSKELTIVGSYAGTYETWPEAIALIQGGRFDPNKIITQIAPLAEIVEALITAEKNKDVIKIQVQP